MALWDWVLAAYERQGVPQAALALQDEHGQNVSFLLWAAWTQTTDPVRLARCAELARRWEALALAPLRQVRRDLKPGFQGVADSSREALREEVKAAELHAERLLVEALEGMGGAGGGAHTRQAALRAACSAWGRAAPDAAIANLVAALP